MQCVRCVSGAQTEEDLRFHIRNRLTKIQLEIDDRVEGSPEAEAFLAKIFEKLHFNLTLKKKGKERKPLNLNVWEEGLQTMLEETLADGPGADAADAFEISISEIHQWCGRFLKKLVSGGH